MGAGSVGLLWYACCCGFVAFTGIVAVWLIVYGRRQEEKRRAARATEYAERLAADAKMPPSEAPKSDRDDGAGPG